VDEVLAVGDAQFQKKCLGKMQDVSENGKTILFVSHNMDAITRLCDKTILLKDGTIAFEGETEKAITSYLSGQFGVSSKKTWNDLHRAPGNDKVRLLEVTVHDENFNVNNKFNITGKIGITMKYHVLQDEEIITESFNIFNENGVHLFSSHDLSEIKNKVRQKGIYTSTMWIPGNTLAEGTHSVSAAVMKLYPFDIYFHEMDAVGFTIYDSINGDSARGDYMQHFPGVMRPLLQWETKIY
jgi:lipopolysaccharide transport system ATP-binding protein